MSLKRECMLVDGHVYSTGTGSARRANARNTRAHLAYASQLKPRPRPRLVPRVRWLKRCGSPASRASTPWLVGGAAHRTPRMRTAGATVRILVLGGDGYLGWPTALHLSEVGHHVAVLDNFARRGYDFEMGTGSLVPIEALQSRIRVWHELTGREIGCYVGDLTDADFTFHVVREFRPDTIVHFAEQRAAPYSMVDRKHAVYTQVNNVVGTLNVLYAIAEIDPDIHLVKLGTMGAYGTPNIDIEEGWIEIEHKGRKDRVLYPKRPGSYYHLSKVHDSHNIEFACRIWGIRATDLNQGVVYGQQTPETAKDDRLATRY